jgi:cytochrome c-type biogenesis protein CcmH/NrfG
MGCTNEALIVLNKFVETNQEDAEAWGEMASIYMNKQNYSKAAYCYEEILAKENRNYLVNLRYAELLYSMTSKPQERL